MFYFDNTEQTEIETLQRAQLYIVIILKAFVYMYSSDVSDCVLFDLLSSHSIEAVRHIAVVVLTP